MKSSADPWRDVRAFSFQVLKDQLRRCLEPSMACKRKAVRAHSIQNATTLRTLAEAGHVVMFRQVFRRGLPSVEFRRVGRKQATTFTGLCARHDSETFRAIEDNPLDIRNPEHLFLLAYRSVLRELHTSMEWAARLHVLYQKRVQLGLSPAGEPDPPGLFTTDRLIAAYETFLYKSKFDEAFLSKDFDAIVHDVVVIPCQRPTLAVSSLSSDDNVRTADDVARVAINVFPQNGNVIAVFSYLAAEKDYARPFHQDVLRTSGDYQKYVLSKLILRCCENFVLSPSYFEGMSERKRALIKSYFVDTVSDHAPDIDDPDLFLF